MAKDPLEGQTVATREAAERLSGFLGCSGAHKVGDAWGPCESQEDLKRLIRMGNPAFREWKKRQKEGTSRQKKGLEYKSQDSSMTFKTRSDAEKASGRLGCSGAHMSEQGKWMPCQTPEEFNAAKAHSSVGGSQALKRSSPPRRFVNPKKWEKLRERGPAGIETIDGGGLVSAKSAVTASDSFKPTNGMITEAKRGLKWRKELKRGGTLVGIARARDIANGKNLPYDTVKRMKAFFDRHQSNEKAQGFRPGEQGFPSNGRIAHALWGGDAGYTWAKDIVERVEGAKKSEYFEVELKQERGGDPKTPAKPSERITGSSRNPKGSASSGKNKIELTPAIEASLKEKARKHNERMRKMGKDDLTVSTGTLKAVWRRGAGAFSVTHRPGMGRQQWAMGRVNAFLRLVSSGKPSNPKYITDNDLLPKGHKRSTKK